MESGSAPGPLVQKSRDSVPIDMLLSAVYVLVVVQSSSEISEGLTNNPVLADVGFYEQWNSAASTGLLYKEYSMFAHLNSIPCQLQLSFTLSSCK